MSSLQICSTPKAIANNTSTSQSSTNNGIICKTPVQQPDQELNCHTSKMIASIVGTTHDVKLFDKYRQIVKKQKNDSFSRNVYLDVQARLSVVLLLEKEKMKK